MSIANLFLDRNNRIYIATEEGPQYPEIGNETTIEGQAVFVQFGKNELIVKLDGHNAKVVRKEDSRGKVYFQATTNSQADIPAVPDALLKFLLK